MTDFHGDQTNKINPKWPTQKTFSKLPILKIDWCEGIFCVLCCFCTYVGQPHNHISWATSIPFTSINPRTNPWNFENWRFWKTDILKNWPFLMKISPNLYGRMDGSKFWCFTWFPENSLLCVKLRYTVYVYFENMYM